MDDYLHMVTIMVIKSDSYASNSYSSIDESTFLEIMQNFSIFQSNADAIGDVNLLDNVKEFTKAYKIFGKILVNNVFDKGTISSEIEISLNEQLINIKKFHTKILSRLDLLRAIN